MTPRRALLLLLCLLPATGFGGESALQALKALPASARGNVLRISADNANPEPVTWYFIARSGFGEGSLRSITVQDGAVTANRPSFDVRTLVNDSSPIDFSRVRIDSDAVWDIARRFASERGRRLGNVSLNLAQRGRGATAVWAVWCYDRAGNFFGRLNVLASTGDILSSE